MFLTKFFLYQFYFFSTARADFEDKIVFSQPPLYLSTFNSSKNPIPGKTRLIPYYDKNYTINYLKTEIK